MRKLTTLVSAALLAHAVVACQNEEPMDDGEDTMSEEMGDMDDTEEMDDMDDAEEM